jgi:hypothetical protein
MTRLGGRADRRGVGQWVGARRAGVSSEGVGAGRAGQRGRMAWARTRSRGGGAGVGWVGASWRRIGGLALERLTACATGR